jgi:formiminoglutamate deiminase
MSIHIEMPEECPVSSSLYCDTALLPGGWAKNVRIEISEGSIMSVQSDARRRPADQHMQIGLPGMANVHSHAFQRGMAGLTETRGSGTDSFWTWRQLMYRFLARMTPDDVEAVTAQAYVEMLESGFTRVGEFHYLHHDPSGQPYAGLAEMAARVAAAAEHTGIGLTLLPVFYAHGNFGGAPPTAGQIRFLNDTDRYARLLEESRHVIAGLPQAMLGVAPHSLRAASPEALARIVPLAGHGPVHIHIAEQLREVEDCLAWSNLRPVEWLLREVAVDSRWCLVHATHMTQAEIEGVASSGAVVGFCPVTESNLGDGIAPAAALQRCGGRFGIGTDSNVLISVSDELRTLECVQRLRDHTRNALAGGLGCSTGRTLFESAVNGGAQALGVLAGLVAGAPADMISLQADATIFAAKTGDALLDSFIFMGGRGCIDGVWRAGRKVVADGRHVHGAAVAARFKRTLQGLLSA